MKSNRHLDDKQKEQDNDTLKYLTDVLKTELKDTRKSAINALLFANSGSIIIITTILCNLKTYQYVKYLDKALVSFACGFFLVLFATFIDYFKINSLFKRFLSEIKEYGKDRLSYSQISLFKERSYVSKLFKNLSMIMEISSLLFLLIGVYFGIHGHLLNMEFLSNTSAI